MDRRDHARIHYICINEKTGEELPWEEIIKGYPVNKKKFIAVDEQVIKKFSSERYQQIYISGFINSDNIDCMSFEKPYYLVADKNGEKGYVILRETLQATHKIAICKVVIHTREYLAAVLPHNNGLLLNTLRYQQQLLQENEFDFPSQSLKHYQISIQEMAVAEQLVAAMTMKWQPEKYHDEFTKGLQQWLQRKIHQASGKKSLARRKPQPKSNDNIVDFIDLLKKSLLTNKKRKSKPILAQRKTATK